MEVRELLTEYDYKGEDAVFVRGSAIEALEGKDSEYGTQAIEKLINALDSKLEFPERPIDKPFLMSVDHCINIGVRTIPNTREEGWSPLGLWSRERAR